jgi:hypothetical protein
MGVCSSLPLPVFYVSFFLLKKGGSKSFSNTHLGAYALGSILIVVSIFNPAVIKWGDFSMTKRGEILEDSIKRYAVIEIPQYIIKRKIKKEYRAGKFVIKKNTFKNEEIEFKGLDTYELEFRFSLSKEPVSLSIDSQFNSEWHIEYVEKKERFFYKAIW